MTTYTIELVIQDNRFTNPNDLGSNMRRKTILRGSAVDDSQAMNEAELVCGKLEEEFAYKVGPKYRTWVRTHTLHKEYKYSSSLVATFKTSK